QSTDQTLVLRNLTLIDGNGGAPRKGVTLVISGGVITEMNADSSTQIPEGATVRDLTGHYVIPGLIDSHVHLTSPSTERVRSQLHEGRLGGRTAVRDMGGDAIQLGELAGRSPNPQIESPRIYYSAIIAGPSWFSDPRAAASAHGFKPGTIPWLRAVSDDTDIEKVVAEARAAGATGLKIYANLPPNLVSKLTAEGHRWSMMVWSHATIYPSRPSDGVAAGVDVISHSVYLYWEIAGHVPDSYQEGRNELPGAIERSAHGVESLRPLLTQMKNKGTILDATLFVTMMLAQPTPSGRPDPRPQFAYAATRLARELGVTVCAGTDSMLSDASPAHAAGSAGSQSSVSASSPSGSSKSGVQGSQQQAAKGQQPATTAAPVLPNLHRELELLVEKSGFTPLEAITAATRNSARAIGIDRAYGTVEVGKGADLVVLTADPSVDIRNTRKIAFVVKGGMIYRRR